MRHIQAAFLDYITFPYDDATKRHLLDFYHQKETLLDADLLEEHLINQPVLGVFLLLLLFLSLSSLLFSIVFVSCRALGNCGAKRYQPHPTSGRKYAAYLVVFLVSWVLLCGSSVFFIYSGISFWNQKVPYQYTEYGNHTVSRRATDDYPDYEIPRQLSKRSAHESRSVFDLFGDPDYDGNFEQIDPVTTRSPRPSFVTASRAPEPIPIGTVKTRKIPINKLNPVIPVEPEVDLDETDIPPAVVHLPIRPISKIAPRPTFSPGIEIPARPKAELEYSKLQLQDNEEPLLTPSIRTPFVADEWRNAGSQARSVTNFHRNNNKKTARPPMSSLNRISISTEETKKSGENRLGLVGNIRKVDNGIDLMTSSENGNDVTSPIMEKDQKMVDVNEITPSPEETFKEVPHLSEQREFVPETTSTSTSTTTTTTTTTTTIPTTMSTTTTPTTTTELTTTTPIPTTEETTTVLTTVLTSTTPEITSTTTSIPITTTERETTTSPEQITTRTTQRRTTSTTEPETTTTNTEETSAEGSSVNDILDLEEQQNDDKPESVEDLNMTSSAPITSTTTQETRQTTLSTTQPEEPSTTMFTPSSSTTVSSTVSSTRRPASSTRRMASSTSEATTSTSTTTMSTTEVPIRTNERTTKHVRKTTNSPIISTAIPETTTPSLLTTDYVVFLSNEDEETLSTQNNQFVPIGILPEENGVWDQESTTTTPRPTTTLPTFPFVALKPKGSIQPLATPLLYPYHSLHTGGVMWLNRISLVIISTVMVFALLPTIVLVLIGSVCYMKSYHPMDRTAVSEKIGQLIVVLSTILLFSIPPLFLYTLSSLVYNHTHNAMCPYVQLQYQHQLGLVEQPSTFTSTSDEFVQRDSINRMNCARSEQPVQGLWVSCLIFTLSSIPFLFSLFNLSKFYLRMKTEFYWTMADYGTIYAKRAVHTDAIYGNIYGTLRPKRPTSRPPPVPYPENPIYAEGPIYGAYGIYGRM